LDFVHVGLLNISPADIRRLAFYLVIRIYSSVTNAVLTLSTTGFIILGVKANALQVTQHSTVAFDAQPVELLHAIS